ncbi:glycerol-3-phosphate dehydrogenase [Micractinium conductrix]|uniref:Glycerol-3-phosphate dehydrogenase [NAD(+)] n=1 Tax=Micractinium conductrix TaxID=554055 RepID=A0A2P6VLA6_9CHLO|nr:glycerol-3-phosphate dehydrogenase [Micractinium conductrix]|eukprot:PSC74868.1 glycerol-3-phosphate dehydrogenase [Micractinium conductrix]
MMERLASLSPRAGGLQTSGSWRAVSGLGPHLEPSQRVLKLWRSAHAVCFDIDCTVALNDQLDLLAEFMGVGESVAAITNSAMDGTMSLEEALEKRLNVINCTPADIQAFLKAHPAESRLTPGARELIHQLQGRGVAVYLISGGFRELCLPICRELGVPPKNLFANRMNWQVDDDTGMPTKLVGFDVREPTGHQGGKPRAIAELRRMFPYETVVMVGDGITDLEAVQQGGGADLFVGFGGVVARQVVMEQADWFVDSLEALREALPRHRVAMIGSGAWACTAVKLIAENMASPEAAEKFDSEVRMWVYEEEVAGRKLTELINETHENVKYMPGVPLGANVVACPDLLQTVKDATILVFCAPHQFIHRIVKQLVGHISKDMVAISLTKGMRVRPDGPQLISELIRKELGVDCSVLMGANIAGDIARGELSEATIAYNVLANGQLLQEVFERAYFYTTLVPDVVGAEMCGTLKNIVALAAGFVEGLGLGPNTRAAIMRAGLNEMRRFAKALYPTVRDDTFFESCGVADLIATCYGGRNRLVAKAYVEAEVAGRRASFEELEAQLLGGQKLQGALTSDEVQEILRRRGWERDYPLFTTVNRIVKALLPASSITEYKAAAALHVAEPAEASADDLARLALGGVKA